MARGLDLRKYQEGILAKLESLSASGEAVSKSRLGVAIGQLNVLVNLAEVSEVISVPEIYKVPLTKSWFLGMANIRGNLYAINDVSQVLGLSGYLRSQASRVLLINQEIIAQSGIVVERLIGLRNLDDMKVSEVQNESKPFCFKKNEYTDSDGNSWYELDFFALVGSKEFIQPST